MMNPETILSVGLSPSVLKSCLRGKLLEIADMVGLENAVRIACVHDGSALDVLHNLKIAELIGKVAADNLSQWASEKDLMYIPVAVGLFSRRYLRHFKAVKLIEDGVSVADASCRVGLSHGAVANFIRKFSTVKAIASKPNSSASEEERAKRSAAKDALKADAFRMFGSGHTAKKVAQALSISEGAAQKLRTQFGRDT